MSEYDDIRQKLFVLWVGCFALGSSSVVLLVSGNWTAWGVLFLIGLTCSAFAVGKLREVDQ